MHITEDFSELAAAASAPLAQPVVVSHPDQPWTAERLLKLADTDMRFELVRGTLLMMSPASPVQGRYAARITAALVAYLDEHDLGEVYTAEPGFKLQSAPQETVRCPDVAFVRRERIPHAAQQAGFWELAPDLAVEIISPSETAAYVQEKVQDYLAAGTRIVWLVYPTTQTVIEYRGDGSIRQIGSDGSLEGGDVLPGLRYPLQRLFRS
jgi:Uma2 family endonuclease